MANILSSVNKTNEIIDIGKFDNKMNFHFCILQFQDIENFYDQGRIIECYLQKKNFLLLPRNICETIENDEEGNPKKVYYYSALLLIWDNYINLNKEEEVEQSFIKDIEKMLTIENKIRSQGGLILNNGKHKWHLSKRSVFNDNNSQYSYLIFHKYKDGKYSYKISSTSSFKKHFEWEGNYYIGAVLDLVFTGRYSNEYNNCYGFDNYKIKDMKVDDQRVILSNVAGVIDLDKCDKSPVNYVMLLNMLPDWKNLALYNADYYSNMSIRIVSLIPEDKVTINNNNVFINGKTIDKNSIVVAKDIETRYNILDTYFRNGASEAIKEFISSKESIEDIIAKFDEGRIRQEKENLIAQKQEAISYIRTARRQIAETEERILMLEHRVKDFIPFPDIVLPKKVSVIREDPLSMLKMINGKYIIEQREEIV